MCQGGRKNAHFRCNYLFWPKFFFGPKQCKAGNTIKNSGFCFWFFVLVFFCFFFFCFFFVSLSLLLLEKKPVFPPKKGIFVYFFSVSLVSLLPCFTFSFFCLSLSLSLSLFLCLSLVLFLFPSFQFFISVSGSCFSFLFCVFSSFNFVLWFLLFCFLFCFIFNHNISFVFALHPLSSFSSCFWFCLLCFFCLYFLILGNQSKNIIKKNGYCKKPKNEKCTKKGHFDKSS